MVARHTILAATAFAAGGLLVLNTTTAAAQPVGNAPAAPTITQIPERPAPDGATVFTSNPAIINGHPQSVESWHRLPDANALAVNFYSGVPACYGVDAEVQQ